MEKKATYTDAYHHWPEQLIMKNKNEGRSVNNLLLEPKLISSMFRSSSVEFIKNRFDAIMKNNVTDEEQSKIYVQSPVEPEKR